MKNWFGPGVWQLPGGGIKVGESVQAAAKREVQEELGKAINEASPLHNDIQVVRQFGLLLRYQFVAAEVSATESMENGRGIVASKWISIDDLSGCAREVVLGVDLARKQG